MRAAALLQDSARTQNSTPTSEEGVSHCGRKSGSGRQQTRGRGKRSFHKTPTQSQLMSWSIGASTFDVSRGRSPLSRSVDNLRPHCTRRTACAFCAGLPLWRTWGPPCQVHPSAGRSYQGNPRTRYSPRGNVSTNHSNQSPSFRVNCERPAPLNVHNPSTQYTRLDLVLLVLSRVTVAGTASAMYLRQAHRRGRPIPIWPPPFRHSSQILAGPGQAQVFF